MAKDPLVTDLTSCGLDDKEARTYLRLARLGKAVGLAVIPAGSAEALAEAVFREVEKRY